MRLRPTISIAFLVLSTAVAAERAAHAQPAPDTPAPPPSGTTDSAPPPSTTAPPAATPAPTTTEQPAPPPPASASASASASAPSAKGIHAALGVGPSGNDFAGLGAQIKIGYRLSPEWRLFVHSANHFYPRQVVVTTTTAASKAETKNTDWHDSALAGVGADYFFLPKLGARASIGLGCDCTDKNKDLGYAFLLGFTFEALTVGMDDLKLTIDPYIQKTQIGRGDGNWTSDTVVGALVSVAYH